MFFYLFILHLFTFIHGMPICMSLLFSAIDFHMPSICSPIVRPGRPAEAAPVVSKQLSDTISRHVIIFSSYLLLVKFSFPKSFKLEK
jgi:hypothetical protein